MTVIAAYNFDNPSEGATVYDDVGSYNGSVVGSCPLSDGPVSSKKRTWASASGGANKLDIGNNAAFELGADRTFEFWGKTGAAINTDGASMLFNKGKTDAAAIDRWQLDVYSTWIPRLLVRNPSSDLLKWEAPANSLAANMVFYLMMTWAAATKTAAFSINGVPLLATLTGSLPNGIPASSYSAYIGGCTYSDASPHLFYSWVGELWAVRVWDEVRTAKHAYDTFHGSNIVEEN